MPFRRILLWLLGSVLLLAGCQGQRSTTPEEVFAEAQRHEQAKQYEEALSLYRKAAGGGHARAQLWLGEYYERGYFPGQDGTVEGPVKKDSRLADGAYHLWSDKWYREAASSFEAAAEAGDIEALVTLASLYYKGAGVGEDRERARVLWNQAAEQAHPLAEHWLGMISWEDQHYDQAMYRFRRAAELGHLPAYSMIATMYFKGEGVPRDLLTYAETLSLAADQGSDHAEQELQDFIAGIQKGAANGYKEPQQLLQQLQEEGLLKNVQVESTTF